MDANEKNSIPDPTTQQSDSQGAADTERDEISALVADHKKELGRLKQEADDNYNLYLRTLADAENGRKRLVKEVENSKRYAMESFFKDLLPVLDGFDKAVQVQDSGQVSGSFLDGVAIVRRQLLDLLEKNGLQEISSKGKKFDPNLHQAIKRTESDEISEELVDEEYAKAYKLYDKLIRPAIVSVVVPTK